tara:strand:+ start:270 stop:734 length:465 start_codon:yes stop_codon:yes gene_type:complete
MKRQGIQGTTHPEEMTVCINETWQQRGISEIYYPGRRVSQSHDIVQRTSRSDRLAPHRYRINRWLVSIHGNNVATKENHIHWPTDLGWSRSTADETDTKRNPQDDDQHCLPFHYSTPDERRPVPSSAGKHQALHGPSRLRGHTNDFRAMSTHIG